MNVDEGDECKEIYECEWRNLWLWIKEVWENL